MKGQDAEQALKNQDQEILNKKEPQGKEKGKSGGGLFKGIVNFIKGIFTATIDMPQQGQHKEGLIQPESVRQGEWLNSSKNPEDLSPKAKLEAQKEGKRLKEGLEGSNAGDQSDKKHGKEHDNEEEITPGGRVV